MRVYRLMLFAVVMLFFLGACITGEVRGTQAISTQYTSTANTVSVTPSHLPTQIMPVTRDTVIPTPAPTTTAVLPTPILPDWILRDFLFENQPVDCELPCWQGLTPGQSSVSETQSVLNKVFGFGGERSSMSNGHGWLLGEDPAEAFNISIQVEDTINILQGIEFRWFFQSLSKIDTNMSPQRVIAELGSPSHILMSVTSLEVSDQARLRLLMIYQRGIVFNYDVIVRITFHENKPSNPIMEFCLGSSRWARGNSPVTEGEVDLMPPLSDDLDDLSPVQTLFIQNKIDVYGVMPVQDILDLSVDEFADTALQGGDACIIADITGKLR
jgi:hypothetical protein